MDDKGLSFYRQGNKKIYAKLFVTIGTKGKESLELNIKKFSKVNNVGQLSGNIAVKIKDGSELELHYEGDNLTVAGSDHALISLQGAAKNLTISNEDNCALYGQEFYGDTIKVDLIDDTLVKLKGSNFVTGEAEDDSALLFSQLTILQVSIRGRARVESNIEE